MIRDKTGINNYDNSILAKVKTFFPNTIYANTAIVYNTVYNLLDNTDNQFSVPLISIYRPTGFSLVPNQNFIAKKQGQLLPELNLGARYITVDLMYQFDIYAKTLEDANKMVVDLIKLFNFYPALEVEHKDTGTNNIFKESYEIEYLSGPTDQMELDNNDRVYRYYIQYEIKNAKLYDFTDYSKVTDVEIDVDASIEIEVNTNED